MNKVSLIFPCDFEKENSKYEKLHKLGYITKSDSDSDNNNNKKKRLDISSPHYSYMTPLIKINDEHEFEASDIGVNHEPIINEIFDSCFKNNFKETYGKKFVIDKILYPYGISLTSNNFDEKGIRVLISDIENNFNGFLLDIEDGGKARPEWIIYDKPIILIKCDKKLDISKFEVATYDTKNNNLKKPQVETVNGAIFYKEDNLTDCIDSVIAAIITLKHTSSYVRVWAKAMEKKEDKIDDIMLSIHKNSAIFEEMRHSSVFRRKTEKQIFQSLYTALEIDDMNEQIKSAKDYLDFLVSHMTKNATRKIEERTDKINTIVLVLGYIGLVLSFLSFVPIELSNILWLKDGNIAPVTKICICIVFICLTIAICNFIVYTYNQRNKIFEYFKIQKSTKKFIDWIRKRVKKCKYKRICKILLWGILFVIFIAFIVFMRCLFFNTFKWLR